MRKAVISLVVLTLVLAISTTPARSPVNTIHCQDKPLGASMGLAEAGSSGNSLVSTMYLARAITSEQIRVLNSYSDTGTHSGIVDLSEYLEPGWHVYEVIIDVNSMVAAPEREVVGVTYETYYYQISEVFSTFNSQLAQGFYNQSFDGSLVNYSIYYSTDDYTPSTRGNASVHISSDYTTSTLLTTKVNMTASDSVFTWATFSGDNAQLDADTVYWAVVNGSLLKKYGSPVETWPTIYWGAEDSDGAFESYKRLTSVWDVQPFEALFNYTFIPWNRTSNAALEFSSPQNLSLQADSVPQTGRSWTFTNDLSNITSIQISTNQSVYLDCNITIWYRNSVTTTTNWSADASGNPVVWNATTVLSYPAFPQTTGMYLDIKSPSDWTPIGLYNGTPTNYGHFSKNETVVHCTDMTDGTWTLSSTAPNYVRSVDKYIAATDEPIGDYVSILSNTEINATVWDGSDNHITGGTANLTITDSQGTVQTSTVTPNDGIAPFLWDISSTTTGNGTHSLGVFWTNGTEAGYYVTEVFVYYSTSMTADSTDIHTYTDSTFDIGIDFNRVFPVTGLDSSFAAVTYSFNSTVNASLSDQGNGRWTQTVSTAGMTDGVYTLWVYAEGYALENRSLAITVTVSYETLALNWSWSNTNSITYLESTNLTVTYQTTGGTRVSNAMVNVTFQGQTFDLSWDPVSENYWILLHGENFTGIPDTFTLNVSAWRDGYSPRFNDTLQITVSSESAVSFLVEWNPSSGNLTFIDSIEVLVTYNYGGSPIPGATVRALFNGSSPVDLNYNATAQKWQVVLNCSDYLGAWTIQIDASRNGYASGTDSRDWRIYEDTPQVSTSWTGLSAQTDYATDVPLTVTVLDSRGNPINDAALTLTVFGSPSTMTFISDGVYSLDITPIATTGVYSVNVTMTRYGFVTSQTLLNLTIMATTTLNLDHFSTEYENWNLTISAVYEDSVYSKEILGASISVTIDGHEYQLQYIGGHYTIELNLTFGPGDYVIHCVASGPFAATASVDSALTILAKEPMSLEIGFDGNLVAGQLINIRATLTSNETHLPISGAIITFRVWVRYVNGTVQEIAEGSMQDTTNNEGVASIGINVPNGQVDSLTVAAVFEGGRTRWDAMATRTTQVEVGVLSSLIAFLTSDIGKMVVGSIALLGIVAAGYNRVVRPRKRAARLTLETQLQNFKDLETLRHFMAVYLDRGTCVFYHPFRDERIQPDLISGFISAITSVYGEIKGDGVRGTLEEIQYQGLRLNSYSGQYIIGILILEGEMTPLLRERLQFFVELFENQYEQDLDQWNGVIDCFDPEWIVSTLNSAFNYTWHLPHKFGPTQKVTKVDAKILDYIAAVRDERAEFYLRDLLAPVAEIIGGTEAQALDRLLMLEEVGAIVPVGVQTILQRQGMGLSNSESVVGTVTSEAPEEESEPVLEKEPEEAPVEPPAEVEVKPAPDVTSMEEPEVSPTAEVQTDVEPQSLEEEPVVEEPDPMAAFVSEVESILATKQEKVPEEEDEIDKFVKDVENLLSKEKSDDDNEE